MQTTVRITLVSFVLGSTLVACPAPPPRPPMFLHDLGSNAALVAAHHKHLHQDAISRVRYGVVTSGPQS